MSEKISLDSSDSNYIHIHTSCRNRGSTGKTKSTEKMMLLME